MLTLSLQGSLSQAYDLIDNRLLLNLSSVNINSSRSVGLWARKEAVLHSVGEAIFYFEKEPTRGSLIIGTSVVRGGKPRTYDYGMALRQVNSQRCNIHIESPLERALARCILKRSDIRAQVRKLAMWLLFTLILIVLVFTPIGWILLLLSPLVYPFYYFGVKRDFHERQRVMGAILSQFEAELPVIERLDTKDWISLTGRLKSAARDFIVP